MAGWTSQEVARLVDGVLVGDSALSCAGCVLDSRQATAGSMFFALPGARVDGFDYIGAAWAQGAVLAVAARDSYRERPLPVPAGKALVLVDSPLSALQILAREHRRALGAKVVGITGSNGKTTTKDMVAAVLGQRYRVHKNQGNQNNELGLPLTILNAPHGTEFLVLEMGMRGLGEIRALCAIAQPEAGVITNIGTTHLELLGSRENIARAKWELVEALPPGGVAVLNAEDEWSVRQAAGDAHPQVFYGLGGAYREPDIRGCSLEVAGELGTRFTAITAREQETVYLPLPGEHNVLDGLAALALGSVYGVSLAEGARGLRGLELSKMRLEVWPGVCGSTLISDVYNANPVSMQASLKVLRERAGARPTVAILGEMYELGPASLAGHREVGEAAAKLGIDELITVGGMAADIAEGARAAGLAAERIHAAGTRSEAVALARQVLAVREGAWVLIKGSRGMKMEEITAGLLAR